MADNAFTVTMTPAAAPRRRLRFVTKPDTKGWWRIEDEWTGCTWRQVGRETLRGLVIDVDHAAVEDIRGGGDA